MFGVRKQEQLLRELVEARERAALAEGQVKERERLVQLLVEQIEYLRAQMGRPSPSVKAVVDQPLAATGMPEIVIDSRDLWMSDEEEDLTAMFQAGAISEMEYEEGLQALRRRDHIIE